MAETTSFKLTDEAAFKHRALRWANRFPVLCLLDSHSWPHDPYSSIDWILAVDAIDYVSEGQNSFDALCAFLNGASEKVFGFLTYDLKNQIEQLKSENPDHIGFPLLYFFKPRYIIEVKDGKVIFNRNYPEAFDLYERIMGGGTTEDRRQTTEALSLKPRTPKEKYLANVHRIKEQIRAGDFYEMNYCCEYYAEQSQIDPVSVFARLNGSAGAPFSAFVKLHDKYLLCASPERFLRKTGNKIISQPIKGTIKRGKTPEENEQLKSQLLHSEKERAENVMIVDLVRNDLAKSAKPGTVKVEELFGIYEFPTVNQMISTVSAELRENIHPVDIIKNAFPMGSMTGAPKVEVMKNIEAYEDQRRGLYSGSVGYFTPDGDFDLNVVIRSIFFNASAAFLSLQVGSAITYDSDPESENDELQLKAKGMLDALDAGIV